MATTMKIICRSWNDVSHGNGDQRPSEVAYEDDPPGKSPRKCRKQRITTIIAYLINAIVIGTAYHSSRPIIQRTQYIHKASSNIITAHLKSMQTCATSHPNSTASATSSKKFQLTRRGAHSTSTRMATLNNKQLLHPKIFKHPRRMRAH